eukprot:6004112-Amphidinium_carterae.1
MDTLAVNLSKLGCGPIWSIYGVQERWTDYRDEVCDIRGLSDDELDRTINRGLGENERLVIAGMGMRAEEQRVALAMCRLAQEKGVAFVLCGPGGRDTTGEYEKLAVCNGVSSGNINAIEFMTNWDRLCASTTHAEASVSAVVRACGTTTLAQPREREILKSTEVKSQLYGVYTKQGTGLSTRTWRDRETVALLNRFIKDTAPVTEYTSVMINVMPAGSSVLVHRDKANMPGSATWVTSFGPFQGRGGRLWVFDVQGLDEPPGAARDKVPPGARGYFKSTYQQWVELNGMCWHAVEPPQDLRYSLSVFTAGNLHQLSERDWNDLEALAFPVTRLRQMHHPKKKALAATHLENQLMEGILAVVDHRPLEAGSHVDEPDPWLAYPDLYEAIYDNISGQALPPELVAAARREEMQFLAELQAYEVVTLEECYSKTNRRPIPVGWVDVNKGDQERPAVRARLVVKETKYNSELTDPSNVCNVCVHTAV